VNMGAGWTPIAQPPGCAREGAAIALDFATRPYTESGDEMQIEMSRDPTAALLLHGSRF